MSNDIFPTLPGLTWNVVKQPEFSTQIQKSSSGKEVRVSYMSSPMYTFKLNYEFLRDKPNSGVPDAPDNEFQTLAGFFLKRKGNFDSFLFSDPTDNQITNQVFGTGNGVKTQFQLIRTWGGSTDIVQNVDTVSAYHIYINDEEVDAEDYLLVNGLITFNSAPESGSILTWSGKYYFRVRFNNNEAEFNQFLKNFWELKKCELYGSLINKI